MTDGKEGKRRNSRDNKVACFSFVPELHFFALLYVSQHQVLNVARGVDSNHDAMLGYTQRPTHLSVLRPRHHFSATPTGICELSKNPAESGNISFPDQ